MGDELPVGWEQVLDINRGVYYVNHVESKYIFNQFSTVSTKKLRVQLTVVFLVSCPFPSFQSGNKNIMVLQMWPFNYFFSISIQTLMFPNIILAINQKRHCTVIRAQRSGDP